MPVRLGLSIHDTAAIRMQHLAGYVGESSEARNTKQVATSSGSPSRLSGVSEPNVATSLAGKVEGISGVQIGPGATAFTRIFLSARAWDKERVKATIAPLVEE